MKNTKKLLALLLAIVMAFGLIPATALAQAAPEAFIPAAVEQGAAPEAASPEASPSAQETSDKNEQPQAPAKAAKSETGTPAGSVFVTVENTTYPKADDGAQWDGILVDHQEIPITSESTMMSALIAALDGVGATQEGAEQNYLKSINGLAAGAPEPMSGWMGTLNDWFTNSGFGDFSVAKGSIGDGDEIKIMFTVTGADLGGGGLWGGEGNDTSLKALEVSKGALSPAFSKDIHEYTLNVPEGTDSVKITPTAKDKNFQVRTSAADMEYKRTKNVPVEDGTVITVKCGDPSWPTMNTGEWSATTYTLNVKTNASPVTTFRIEPADAAIYVTDATGKSIPAGENANEFALQAGEEYTYTLSKYGYITQHDTFTAEGIQTIEANLAAAPENTLTKYDSEWPSFRNSSDNMGIVDAKTPRTQSDTELLWATKLSSGWGNSVSSPIIVGNKLYVMVGSSIKKIDKTTGEVEATTGTAASSGGFTVHIAYGEGMIFAPISNGQIQAFDANTLESLWISEKLGGQTLTPLTYENGYLYTGFRGTGSAASFICLSVTDEDPGNTSEIKYPTWVKRAPDGAQEGYYWAGACVVGNAVVFGVDTGILTSYSATQNKEIDTYQVDGDIRSSIAKDGDRLYFTTKAGKVYSIRMNADGTFDKSSVKSGQAEGVTESTSTPVIYNGRVYVGGSGSSFTEGTLAVMDASDMSTIYSAKIGGKAQASALFTTAYHSETGKVYAYFTYNNNPGGITVLEDSQGQTEAKVSELFVPTGDKSQYCICSPIADSDGTIYYKNDSGYVMALGAKDENKLPVRKAGVPAETTENIALGGSYTLELSTIFEDADNDPLTYKVSINGTDAVTASESYSYQPTAAGMTILQFTANDGKADSADTYTVILTVTVEVDPMISEGNFTRTGDTEASIEFKANKTGNVYYTVVPKGTVPPQIDTTGEGNAATVGKNTLTLEGITAGSKDIYIVLKDAKDNVSDAVKVELPGYSDVSAKLIEDPQLSTGIFWTPLFEKGRSGNVRFAYTHIPMGTENVTFTFKAPEGIEIYDSAKNKLTPDAQGVYSINIAVTSAADNEMFVPDWLMGKGGQSVTFQMKYGTKTADYRLNVLRRNLQTGISVVDYLCVGSQYTNNGNYGLYPERMLIGGDLWSTPISVGGFGGYITFKMDEPVTNDPKNPYGIDLIINGNGGGPGFSEPGNVYVSKDGNKWYMLAGSDYFDDNTEWNYELTYTGSDDKKIHWQDQYGNTGTMTLGQHPPKNENYPMATFDPSQPMTVSGALLKSNAKDDYGTNAAAVPDWGYVDAQLNREGSPYTGDNTRGGGGFDLSWAVDENGKQVQLDSIQYVKVATASHIDGGAIGEKSTEVNAVHRVEAAEAVVGKTTAPAGISVNGRTIKLAEGVYGYGAYFGEGAVKIDVDASDGTNVYINNAYGTTRTYDSAPEKGIIRIVVQEGEKEPLIYYLNAQSEAEALPQIKEDAKGSLDTYKNTEDYRDAQKAELASEIAQGKAAIDQAASIQGVEDAVAAAKEAIDAVKTDTQLTAEELAAAKETAKTGLENYKNADDYRDAQKTELANAIASGKTAIDRVTAIADVDKAVAAAKEEIDKIKTDAQLTAEELVSAKNNAKTELEQYKKASDYRETERALWEAEVAKGRTEIGDAIDKAAVQRALTDAKAKIDKIKTDAQWAAEENAAAAKAVDDKIGDIGTVTLESKAKIDVARTAYDMLNSTQKTLVTKLDVLKAAEAKYKELKAAADKLEADKAAAKGVDDLIDQIGTVTLQKESAIQNARTAYNALTNDQKALVQGHETLKNAEGKLAVLKVKALIEQVSDKVTFADQKTISAADKAYDALSSSQRAEVGTELKTKLDLAKAEMERMENKLNTATAKTQTPDGVKLNTVKPEHIPLTDEEKTAIANGAQLHVSMEMKTVTEQAVAADAMKVKEVLGNNTVAAYLDLNLFKQVDGSGRTAVSETGGMLTFTLDVLPEWKGTEGTARVFRIIRVHNGIAEVLEDTDNDPNTITFGTDRFSTYAVAYEDQKETGTGNDQKTDQTDRTGGAKTGDTKDIWGYVILAIAAAGAAGTGLLLRRKKKNA